VKKLTNIIISLTIALSICIGLIGCSTSNVTQNNNSPMSNNKERETYKETLKVYNAAEYIDETTIADFEKEFKVKVEYAEFESNEDMYSEVVSDPNAYDVLVPSDYTIDRLIKEGRLARLESTKIPNIANVSSEYLKPQYDPNNEYVVPYMVGTLGILYNKKMVSSPIDSWTSLFDSKYNGKILMWDSQRDVLGATLKMLGFSVNSNNADELSQVQSKLIAQRQIIQGYGEEEIRDKMIADEGAIALMYSGEAKTAIDQNPNLKYVIPKEGSNKWVDGFVIMKNTKHLEAAHNFINFMCRPNIAVRNMTNTGYTSPISGAWAEFNNNKIMFPTKEELDRCEAFLYDASATPKYNDLWTIIR